jgi:NitT/TauT family transport system substrate-binding protein
MKNLIAAFALAALALTAASPARVHAQGAPTGGKKLEVIKGAHLKSLSFSPLYLAMEKGYLREEGIEVELQIVQSASQVVAFLGAGQLDMAFGNIGAPLFNAASRDLKVQAVAGMSYYPADPKTQSPAPIIASKAQADAGAIRSVADLKGRKIAFNTRGGVIEYLATGGLARVGLKLSDVEIVTLEFPAQATALANGAIDAAILPEPLATSTLQRGLGTIIDPNPVPGALGTILMFGPTLLDEKRAAVANAILRALRRAAAEIATPEAVMSSAHIDIWAKATELPPALIAKTAPYVFHPQLGLSAQDFLQQQKLLEASGLIPQGVPQNKLISPLAVTF